MVNVLLMLLLTATPALEQAGREGLPVASLEAKRREGETKGVAPEALEKVLAARLERLREGDRLLREAGYAQPNEMRGELVTAVALALESGLGPEDLRPALQAGGGWQMRRVQAVVEAGEALHLAGIPHETLRELLALMLERELSRSAVLRAVAAARAAHRAGAGPDVLRACIRAECETVPGHGPRGGR